jgi:hypothetical protein
MENGLEIPLALVRKRSEPGIREILLNLSQTKTLFHGSSTKENLN